MTVIVWDGTTLAADKQTSFGGSGFAITKLGRTKDLLFGCSGNGAMCRQMSKWVLDGRHPEQLPVGFSDGSADVLVVERGGKVLLYSVGPLPTIIEETKFAIGSGMDFALGALYAGANAYHAVLAANRYSNSCGMGVDTLVFEEEQDDWRGL